MSVRRIAVVIGLASALALAPVAVSPAAATDATAKNGGGKKSTIAFAVLNGAQEVPPRETPGFGFAVVRINTRTAEVCYVLIAKRLTAAASAAHIHRGAVGVNGGIVLALELPDPVSRACATVTPELAAELAATPAQFYTNVHTPTYPGGEIRGQLS